MRRNAISKSFNKSNDITGSFDFRLTNNILPQVEIEQDSNIENSKAQENIFVTQSPTINNVVQEDFKQILKLKYSVIGIAFDTYLILQYNENLYFIDQHAGHERLKYDEIMHQLESNSLTKLLNNC